MSVKPALSQGSSPGAGMTPSDLSRLLADHPPAMPQPRASGVSVMTPLHLQHLHSPALCPLTLLKLTPTLYFLNVNQAPQPPYLYLLLWVELCPLKRYIHPNPWYLSMWPYLEIRSLRCSQVKMRSDWNRVGP